MPSLAERKLTCTEEIPTSSRLFHLDCPHMRLCQITYVDPTTCMDRQSLVGSGSFEDLIEVIDRSIQTFDIRNFVNNWTEDLFSRSIESPESHQ
jgi:hypothetical protein